MSFLCFSASARAAGHEAAAGTCREGAPFGAAAATTKPAGERAGETSTRSARLQPEPQGQRALPRE